jgi:hypothetical protein
MSDYRDELRACNERIAQVEAELARRGGPRKPPAPAGWFVALGVGIFALGLVVLSAMAFAADEVSARSHRHESTVTVPVPAETAEPRPYLGGAQWYASRNTPILHDVNGDGVQDIVGLAWDRRDNERALHAVAFDGRTHQLLWHTVGVPSQWAAAQVHLVRAKQHLVLTDSRSMVHVFDIDSGKELRTAKLDHEVRDACVRETGSVALLRSQTTEQERYDDFSPETGKIVVRAQTPACVRHAGPSLVASPEPPKGGGIPKTFVSYTAYSTSFGQLSIGQLAAGDAKAADTPYAALMGRKAEREPSTRWHTQLAAAGETVSTRAPTNSVVDNEALYFIYVTPGVHQEFRVVARSLGTGSVLWTQRLTGTDEGQRPQDFAAEDGRVFVAMGGTLHVLDAKTGAPKPSIVSF